MSWDDVRIFLAVARSGQILGAAKRLGVNHATVARRLTALENDINTKLLTRRTNGCELTHAGEEFLLSAERMEAEMLSMPMCPFPDQCALARRMASVSPSSRRALPPSPPAIPISRSSLFRFPVPSRCRGARLT